jgi:hypothetical protein
LFVHGDTYRIQENSEHVPWVDDLIAPAAAAAAETAAARPVRTGFGLVDLQAVALEVFAV